MARRPPIARRPNGGAFHSARETALRNARNRRARVELADERKLWIVRLITLAGFAKTNGEARRLVEQGGVTLNDEKVTDPTAQITYLMTPCSKSAKRTSGACA
jgi:tyrosyl-tRNA synthetase